MKTYQMAAIGIVIIIVGVTLGYYFGVYAPAQREEETLRRTLIISTGTGYFLHKTLRTDPHYTTVYDFIGPSYETLLGLDPDELKLGNTVIIPWLAESMPTTTDYVTWTIKLREGVKFASGNEMTAEDVKFSFDRLINWDGWMNIDVYGRPPVSQYAGTMIDQIHVVDDYTLTVICKSSSPVKFIIGLTMSSLTVMEKAVVMEHDQDGDLGTTWLDDGHSAGTGPFEMVSGIVGERIEYERNEYYWGGLTGIEKPFFEKIIVIGIQEGGTKRLQLERNEMHLVTDLELPLIDEMQKANVPNIKYEAAPAIKRYDLVMQTDGTDMLADVKVREAIKMAIDYDGLVDMHAGYVDVAQSCVLKGLPGYDSDFAYYYETDVEGAKALLTQAGYADGFAVDLMTFDASLWGISPADVVEKLGADFAEVGIDCNILVVPWATMAERMFAPSPEGVSPTLYLKPYGGLTLDGDDQAGLAEACRWPNADSHGWNSTYLPDVDFAWLAQKINASELEADGVKRAAIFQELDEYLLKWSIWAGLMQPQDITTYRDDITDVHLIPFRGPDWTQIRRI